LSDFIIAVDGPAAAGKGAIAAQLGRDYGLPVLDTGLLYRAVGVTLIQKGGDLGDEPAATLVARTLDPSALQDPAFRTRAAGEAASRVAPYPGVRETLREFQRSFARQPGGAVIDGRDIGTVIVPEAPAKLYVTATPLARAQRRVLQLQAAGEAVSLAEILADIEVRDARDAGRADSPMRPAVDAVLLDTTEMSISAAADAARRIVEQARGRWEASRSRTDSRS
jgi:cytidylate kinase